MRAAPLALLLALAPLASAPADPLALARSHLAAGRLEPLLEVLADSAGLPAAEVAGVFADASALAFERADLSLAAFFCERALGHEPRQPRALRTCASVALQEGRALEALEWADTLRALLPADGEVALLQARAARALGDWERVSALLEPLAEDAAVGARAAPLLAEARQRTSPPPADRKLDEAVRAARRLNQEAAVTEERSEVRRKRGLPSGERIVFYAGRRCPECDRAREWMQENDIDFEERNADSAARSDREYLKHCSTRGCGGQKTAPRCPMPLFFLGDMVLPGFSESTLKKLLLR